ncbi:helix-turn-helix domain-containing protein [Parafrankia elaeagni]|uniref:helix-turn-helix domain-containing protein n=1 Tax=Parafrankia elaeagni TaxID=222534 RepID=UPI00039C8A0E|nr:helix-turn-helix domain-containing protein [Parafrankia elaeagni]
MQDNAFGRELRRRREAAGLNQRQLAEALSALAWDELRVRVGADGNLVSRWERGTAAPRPPYPDLLARLFRATPEELGLRPGLPPGADSRAAGEPIFEPTMKILDRMRRAGSTNVSDSVLDQLERMTKDAVGEYERLGPLVLVPRLVKKREWVDGLCDGRQTLRQRARLYGVAARLSGLLGSLAVDRGDMAAARAYCDEAFQLADLVEDDNLRAWVRGTQALAEYYAGEYRTCLDLAVDGLEYGRGGPQEARLLVQGQARAAGRLGDTRTVLAAVDRARELAADYPPGAVSPCLALDGYCSARIDGNAATALLSAGDVEGSRRFAFSALARFDAAGMAGPRSLTRIDIAMTFLSAGEPDRAAELVGQALTISAARPIATVAVRTGQFLEEGRRYLPAASMRGLVELAADWENPPRPALARS